MPRRPPKDDDELILPPTQDEIDLETFITEIGPSISCVDIFRMKPGGARPHIDRVTMDTLRADVYAYLREEYGNGKYLLQFKTGNLISRSKMVEIEGAKEPKTEDNGKSGASDRFERMLEEERRFNRELLVTIATSNKGPDMGALLTGLANMAQANRVPVPDPTAMLTAVSAVFTALKGAGSSDENSTGKILDMAAKVLEIGRNATGGGNGGAEDNIYSLAKAFAGPVIEKMAGGPAPLQLTPGNVPEGFRVTPLAGVQPVGHGAQPVAGAPVESGPGAPPGAPMPMTNAQWIRIQIDFLKKKAGMGKPVEDWIDYILDNQEEPGCAAIVGALRQPGVTFEHLLQLDAEIAQNPAYVHWFRLLFDGLYAEIRAEVDSGREGRDAGDARNHETVDNRSGVPVAGDRASSGPTT